MGRLALTGVGWYGQLKEFQGQAGVQGPGQEQMGVCVEGGGN